MESSLIQDLNWRYACKVYDPEKKISGNDLDQLLESLRLSPSSFGLQPWRFLVITDPQVRGQLKPACWNQPQITDASQLIVLCSRTDINKDMIEKHLGFLAQQQGIEISQLVGYGNIIKEMLGGFSEEQKIDWAKKQAYLALGFLLNACARLKIDSTPMEGFEADKVNNILNLKEQNLSVAVMCALGYRSAADRNAHKKKARWPKEEIFKFI